MNFSRPFIQRPVMTILLMVAILLGGSTAFWKLPVSNLPNIPLPVIVVQAENPGASAALMANTVADPLEAQFMSISGIQQVLSTSNEGISYLILLFNPDKDLTQASGDVQQAIVAAEPYLPTLPNPPTYTRINPADTPVFLLSVTSDSMALPELYDLADLNVEDRLSVIPGVSQVVLYGPRRSIRVKADADRLAAQSIGLDQMATVINNATVYQPGGRVYDVNKSYTLEPNGELTHAQQYGDLYVAYQDGAPVQLNAVANAIEGTQVPHFDMSYWTREAGTQPAVTLVVYKQPTANTVTVAREVRKAIPELRKDLPNTVRLEVFQDSAADIESAITDAEWSLWFGVVLVAIVIYLFLGRLRLALVPAVALPLTLLATFCVMYLMGFTLDLLSIMALIMVMGFLVDDAIVVLENIYRHREEGMEPVEAAIIGTKQVGFTVVGMTLSLCAVFFPLLFMPGTIGLFFREFGWTAVIAVLFSGLISLTTTPMLAARAVKAGLQDTTRMQRASRRAFDRMSDYYVPRLRWLLANRWLAVAGYLLMLILIAVFLLLIPHTLFPAGNNRWVTGYGLAAADSSPEAMVRYQSQANAILQSDPAVDGYISVVNDSQDINSNQTIVYLRLVEAGQRPPLERVLQSLREKLSDLAGMDLTLQPQPLINFNVGATYSEAEYEMIVKTEDELEGLNDSVRKLVAAFSKIPGVLDLNTDLDLSGNQLFIDMQRQRAASLGLDARGIEQLFVNGLAEGRLTIFHTPLDTYNVVLQLAQDSRSCPEDLDRLYLASRSGEMVPLSNVIKWRRQQGPLLVNHYNRALEATVYFNLAPRTAFSSVAAQMQKIADETLPEGTRAFFSGQAKEAIQLASRFLLILTLSLAAIYLILGILYEDFVHPITILTASPGAAFGALFIFWISGQSLTIYSYLGIIVVIGIVLKNGIMLVNFATHLRHNKGLSPEDAVCEAARLRFRPILMTTIAAATGALPLALGWGLDAASRRPLGLALVVGLAIAQLITYFFTPVAYCYLEKMKGKGRSDSKYGAGARP